jgi:hypothetical protein
VRDPQAEAPELLRDLVASDIDVYLCEPVQPSLEDLFLELVEADG